MAIFSAVASIFAGKAQKDAAKEASAASERATAASLDLQKYIYDTTREDYEPWMQVGESALRGIIERVDRGEFSPAQFNFEKSPGYDFRRREGEKAMERSAAGRGMVLSGPMLKELTRFNQDYAAGEYQAAYNRNALEKTTHFDQLASLAQVGQTGQRTVAAAGTNYANAGQSAYMQNAANVGEAAYAGGNAMAGMYGNLGRIGAQTVQNAITFGNL